MSQGSHTYAPAPVAEMEGCAYPIDYSLVAFGFGFPLPPPLAVLALGMAVVFVLSVRLASLAGGGRQRAALVAVDVAVVYLGISAFLAQSGVLTDFDARSSGFSRSASWSNSYSRQPITPGCSRWR